MADIDTYRRRQLEAVLPLEGALDRRHVHLRPARHHPGESAPVGDRPLHASVQHLEAQGMSGGAAMKPVGRRLAEAALTLAKYR